MNGRGLPPLGRGRTGDLRVVVNVVIPRKLSRKQRDLLEAARRLADRGEPARARGDAREAQAGAGRVIRLGIRVRAADAEIAFARLEPVLAARRRGGRARRGRRVRRLRRRTCPDARLRALAGDTLIAVTREPVDPGWDRAWHEHIEPVTVGALTFRPPWIPAATAS